MLRSQIRDAKLRYRPGRIILRNLKRVYSTIQKEHYTYGPSNKWWFAAAWDLAMCQKNADVLYGKYIRKLLAHTRF